MAWKEARNSYFYNIQIIKQAYWDKFLANANENEIYTTYRYTKKWQLTKIPTIQYMDEAGNQQQVSEFGEKYTAFLHILFPNPPPPIPPSPIPSPPIPPPLVIPCSVSYSTSLYSDIGWEWPELEDIEIESAIFSSNNKKAPGGDSIGFALVKRAYSLVSGLFNKLYKACFRLGYHPRAWRNAVGIILPKPNKPDYSAPKTYRIISLLNCLRKVLEKVFVSRLGYLVNINSLGHES